MKAFLVFIFVSAFLALGAKTFLLVAANAADEALPSSTPQPARANINSQFINLSEILKHQQALVEECHKLEHFRMGQLKRLVQFNQDNGQVHLGNPILLQMPAVCLLLNGPPSSDLSAEPKLPIRLDIANWLYDTDDLIDHLAQASTNKSHQVKRREAMARSQDNDDLLASHYFDVDKARPSSNDQSLDANSLEEKQIQDQLEQLVQDERFQQAIHQGQAKIEPLLSPVVLVPGLAGSRLQARVMKKHKVNIICKKQHDWQEMWLSLTSFLPVAIDCWIDNARLEYDPTTGFVRDPPGVESRVPEFGSIESVRHLDLKSPKLTKYFDAIIERYLKLGYQADRNLFAAPYDFRLAPQQLEDTFFVQLRHLIDRAASGGGGGKKRPVTLVCHSMGCTHLLVFLRQQSSAWRQAKVRKVIALSSPWAGSIKALKALVVGEQFNMPIVSELKMRELTRTFPSVAYLLPQPKIFGEPNANHVDFNAQLLVQTPERSYKVDQLGELLQDLGLEQQWQWYQRASSLIQPQNPLPDVHLDCIHSINMPTTETIIFRNQTDFPDGNYELAEGDGDGTVNHQSLLVCAQWAQMLPERIKHKVIPNTSHTGLLSHQAILEYITEDVAINRP